MAKKPRHHRKRWSKQEVSRLRKLARQNRPTRGIASKLRRTVNAVRSEASEKGISLRPRD